MTTPPLQLSDTARNKLIEQHTEYVRSLAARVRRDIGSSDLDPEEFVAYGMRGLVEAADRYDPRRGVAFTTFSYYRIRGAIFDGLRKIGWLNRTQYARFQQASNELLQSAADRPAPPESGSPQQRAEHAGQELTDSLDQLAVIFVASLDQSQAEQTPDPNAVDAEGALANRDASTKVRQAVAQLPGRERELIEAYYFEDLTLEAAGRRLGLSKSWTSRLHARAVKHLTELMDPALAD